MMVAQISKVQLINGFGTASNGCIVASFNVRKSIADSGDRELIVK